MDPVTWLLARADPVLIAPYRWLEDPMEAWWLGTLVLAFYALVLGEATLALFKWVIREHLAQSMEDLRRQRDLSLAAARAGDKPAFKLLNRQANEAFGKTFFQGIAMGAASLWPAFLALAWLRLRFSQVGTPLPGTDINPNYAVGFIICYVVLRVIWGRLRARTAQDS